MKSFLDDMRTNIIDQVMQFPVIRILNPAYKKHREGLLYLFFGFLSFAISLITYAMLICVANVLVANIFAWIISVTFAYITNRLWVFESTIKGVRKVVDEMLKFYMGRLLSLLMEEIVLFIFVSVMGFGKMEVKLAASVLVIIANYLISKLWVFASDKCQSE